MTSRDPSILGAAINSETFAGVIVDGHHVAWEMVGLACRARPLPQRMFMVSDAMATIGGPDHFDLKVGNHGGQVVVEARGVSFTRLANFVDDRVNKKCTRRWYENGLCSCWRISDGLSRWSGFC